VKPSHNLPRFLPFTILFITLGLVDLFAVSYYPSFRWISKPLIMISLISYYFFSTRDRSLFNVVFFAGLIAALLGDVFLLLNGEKYFLLGLGSFLIMQVIYIFTFIKGSYHRSTSKGLIALVFLVTLIYFLKLLWPHLDAMAIPVSIYSLIIVVMAISALMRNKNLTGYNWVLGGAILFMISDGFIAWNKFMTPVALGGIIVMSTYILAQYFILMGMLKGVYSTRSE